MHKKYLFPVGLLLMATGVGPVYAQVAPVQSDPEFDDILSQDISGLTVTSVAKRSQRLNDTAAAVYVITQEEIRRAGIYSIPEALRLVPGMQVAKNGANRWGVASRGFNGGLNNKLLVLIDGRTVYTPVFSGVYWDDQGTSINDIDRIEVIRGPGASLYGANAVNGVINIITKSAEDTQGNMVSATTTTRGNGIYEARHGGKISEETFYRGFMQYQDSDSWHRERAGFRVDGRARDRDTFTLQGDAYTGEQQTVTRVASLTGPGFVDTLRNEDDSHGGNILGRWNHKVSTDSDLSVQAYLDTYSRLESIAKQNVTTADIQAQHSIKLDERNNFIWGGGARMYYQDLKGTFAVDVNDQYSVHEILNVFAQNEYALIPNELYFTAGSKLEYNDYTGVEVQPSVRLAWHATDKHMFWGAISRAVRTPSTIEDDISLLSLVTAGPTEYRVFGNPDQESEELIAYELGHRWQARKNLSFDTALFLNDYDNLQTISTAGSSFLGANGSTIVPYTVNNLGRGQVYGAEIAANWVVNSNWHLSGSYSFMQLNLDVEPGTTGDLDSTERSTPKHQFAIQSYYNLTDSVHFDNMIYYVDHLSAPVDSYVRYDARIAWMVQPGLEVSMIGRNLGGAHEEFPSTPQTEVDRSFIGQVLWKF